MCSYGLHWFRRDLRVYGNPGLDHNRSVHSGKVLGVFFFDSTFLSRPDFSNNRFGFFLNSLVSLRDELRLCGSDLLVIDSEPSVGFWLLFDHLRASQRSLPKLCTFNRDYEPFARQRDCLIEDLLQKKSGIPIQTFPDHLLIEPTELKRPDGGTYQIFTPFSRFWFDKLNEPFYQRRIKMQEYSFKSLSARLEGRQPEKLFHLNWDFMLGSRFSLLDRLEKFIQLQEKKITVPLPQAGSVEAFRKLLSFKNKLYDYEKARDFPAESKTSELSIYLKNGSITASQVFGALQDLPSAKPFLRQLVWREFYFHILFHHPFVEQKAFRPKYQSLKFENSLDRFEAWKQGKTGFPIVDAGMRQLLKTGFMHNRVRMVVASFLVKDLLIDWRWGERWFMQNLLDGDLAANNGGWQWAASTGCDPQPYFRIFNPVLQSQKFDPDGSYIRQYVAELKGVPAKNIHEPHLDSCISEKSYPKPIVIHSDQKKQALLLYQVKER